MNTERWKPVPGFDGWYDVSDHGRVRSCDRVITDEGGRQRRRRGQSLVLRLNRYGYPMVQLKRNGVIKHRTVHSLVLVAFVGPRPDGAVSRHLDGNRANANASNLVWGTQSQNMLDRVAHGNDPNANKTECRFGHPYSGANLYMSPNGRRDCRTCARDRSARYKSKLVAS